MSVTSTPGLPPRTFAAFSPAKPAPTIRTRVMRFFLDRSAHSRSIFGLDFICKPTADIIDGEAIMHNERPPTTLPPSGPWTGYYIYFHSPSKHRMKLGLTFTPDGKIDGEGIDDVARFVITGV